MANLDNRLVAQDATAMLAHAEADAVADTSRVGVTGYCMSGPFALWIAAEFPDVVKSAASIHGVRLAVDAEDSPHTRAVEMKGEILVMAAEHDAYVDRAHYDRLVSAFEPRLGPMPIASGSMVLTMVLCFPTEPCSTQGRQNVTGNCCTAC